MIKKEPGPQENLVTVTFELPDTIWAESVELMGDFNDWGRKPLPMQRGRSDEQWRITINLRRGKEYQFRYLVNGSEWYNDWDADRYVPNPYGGDNSVLVL